MSNSKTILIVGGGLAGCALAHAILQNTSHKVILFERDSSQSARYQGLIIGLSQKAVDILRSSLDCSVDHLFSQKSSSDLCLIGTSFPNPLIVVKNILTVKVGNVTCSSLVDRAALRQIMIERIPKESVLYDKKFTHYECIDDIVIAHFEDGTFFQGNLLVGADGGRSQVRNQFCPKLIPENLPYWTNAGTIDLDSSSKSDSLLISASRKALVRKSGKNGISWLSFVNEQDGKYMLLWSISMPSDVAQHYELDSNVEKEEMFKKTLTLVNENFVDNEDVSEIISSTTLDKLFPGYNFTSVLPETLNSNPFNRLSKEMVTIIGDAAHKTTTQAGLGATAALEDAQEISKIITNPNFNFSYQELRKYESDSVSRALYVVKASVGNTRRIHGKNVYVIAFFQFIMRIIGLIFRLYYFISSFIPKIF